MDGKRNEVPIQAIMRVNLEKYVEQKKPDTKDHILHDSIFMKHLKQANNRGYRSAVAWAGGIVGEKQGVTTNSHRASSKCSGNR